MASHLVCAHLAVARPSATSVNLREQCRQAVAGPYLSAYDRHQKAKQQLLNVVAQRTETKTKLDRLEAEYEQLREIESKKRFDIGLAAQKNQLIQTLGTYRSQLKAYADLETAANDDQKRFAAEQESIRKAMGSIFQITNLPAKDAAAGYPFRVDYKHTCNQYRRLCPLPVAMARELQTIKILGTTPVPCQRYANFTNLH